MHNFDEIPKRNPYSFGAAGKPAERSPMQSLLSRTKLSNLRTNEVDEIPFPGQSPIKPALVCVNCKSSMTEREFLKVRICPACMQGYAVMSDEIDRAADEKAKANRLKMFAVK